MKQHRCEHDSEYPAILHMFQSIQDQFPDIRMNLDRQSIRLDIPEQNQVAFPIRVENNACDLFLYIEGRYLMWGTIGEDTLIESCKEAVCGLLSGGYRAVQYHVGPWCVWTEVQRSAKDDWEKIYGQGIGCEPIVSRLCNRRILQNVRT